MKTSKFLFVLCFALLAIPAFAHDSNACSPVGVWYGGSDYKYLLTITPLADNTFALQYEAGFSNSTFGYSAWTSWRGQLKKQGFNHYVGQVISLYTTSSELPPPETS